MYTSPRVWFIATHFTYLSLPLIRFNLKRGGRGIGVEQWKNVKWWLRRVILIIQLQVHPWFRESVMESARRITLQTSEGMLSMAAGSSWQVEKKAQQLPLCVPPVAATGASTGEKSMKLCTKVRQHPKCKGGCKWSIKRGCWGLIWKQFKHSQMYEYHTYIYIFSIGYQISACIDYINCFFCTKLIDCSCHQSYTVILNSKNCLLLFVFSHNRVYPLSTDVFIVINHSNIRKYSLHEGVYVMRRNSQLCNAKVARV